MDKNILFLILTLVCVYLIMSEFFGQKYITNFVNKIVGSGDNE